MSNGLILIGVSLITRFLILLSLSTEMFVESRLTTKTYPVSESTSIPHGLSVFRVVIIPFCVSSIIEMLFEK